MKDVRDDLGPTGRFDVELAIAIFLPATHVLILVFPFSGITSTGLCLHIVPPHVFRPLAVGPHVFAGATAGVTADALIQMKHHGNLRSDIHEWQPIVLGEMFDTTRLLPRSRPL